MMSMDALKNSIKTYLNTDARPLEKALYAYHFDDEDVSVVINELFKYQNLDGGFGHGLEPDFLLPKSSPIASWTAANIIRDLSITNHLMIDQLLFYLENCPHQTDGLFHTQLEEMNDHPHAPWWHFDASKVALNYNPTASLLGFMYRYMTSENPTKRHVLKRIHKAIKYFLENDVTEMHELRCFVELYHDLLPLMDVEAFGKKLEKMITTVIEKDHLLWFSTYCVKPSHLIISKETPGYMNHKSLIDLEHELLLKNRNASGIWSVTWDWSANDPKAFEYAKRAWQGIIAVSYLSRFKQFNFKG